MLNIYKKNNIPFLKNKNVVSRVRLSNSFGAFCEKIKLEDNSLFIVKGLKKVKKDYDSIYYEGKSLDFMHNKFPNLFPKVLHLDKNILVIKYINHNNIS